MRLVGFAAGLLIVAVTAASMFTTLVIPRTTSSRLLRSISKVLAKGLRPFLRVLPSYEAKAIADALTHLIVPPPAPWLPSRPELGDPPLATGARCDRRLSGSLSG